MPEKRYFDGIKEKEKERTFTKGPMRRLYAYALPHWPAFLAVFALIIVNTAVTLMQPKIVQTIIDRDVPEIVGGGLDLTVREAAIASARNSSLLLLGFVFISFVAGYMQAILLQKTGQTILRNIRQTLYEHMLRLPTPFFDHYPLGSLVTRITNDTETLNEMFTSVLSGILRNVFTLVGIVYMMLTMNWRLAAWILGLIPIVLVISVVFRKIIRKVYEEQRRLLSFLNSKISENISGMRTIHIFHREKQIYEEFDEQSREYLKLNQKELQYFAIYRPAIEIVRSLGIAALLWFGGGAYIREAISFGVLYAFVEYIERFFQPILELAETYNVVQAAMTYTERIFYLMDIEEEDKGGKIDVPAAGLRGHIEFRNVWFAYNREEWILKNLSFEIKPGEFVAFVGATGAGKSTIMHLLCRFYDIEKGQILLDGVDIREYCLASLRRAIGVVQQNVFLYSGNILDNITPHREEVTAERAKEAARLVHADGFLHKLPKGYEEKVTERGSTLSAGKRQLLSFTRTISAAPIPVGSG